MAILALAESTLSAMFDPRGASEANHIHFIQASFGDVIADGVGLAGVSDTARTALVLREHTEFTLHLWARQGPTVDFPLQAAALLAILDPGVTTVVQGFSILMEALTAKPWVTFRAAKKINRGVLTVTDHPATHYKSILT